MTTKYFYKVVAKTVAGQLVSYNVCNDETDSATILPDTERRLTYKPNVSTLPILRGSKLFAFAHYKDAKNCRSATHEVWKCTVKNPRWLKRYDNTLGSPRLIALFWEAYNKKKARLYAYEDNRHTIVGDEITLISKVSDER